MPAALAQAAQTHVSDTLAEQQASALGASTTEASLDEATSAALSPEQACPAAGRGNVGSLSDAGDMIGCMSQTPRRSSRRLRWEAPRQRRPWTRPPAQRSAPNSRIEPGSRALLPGSVMQASQSDVVGAYLGAWVTQAQQQASVLGTSFKKLTLHACSTPYRSSSAVAAGAELLAGHTCSADDLLAAGARRAAACMYLS